jgi:YD repeat-containing protein
MKFTYIDKRKVRCPRCGSPMVIPTSINETPSSHWLRCSQLSCKTFFDTFVPLDSQMTISLDTHKRVGVFGGYGSGKTSINYKNDEKHIMITENGETLIGAATLVQIDNTIKKDFENDFPLEFVKQYSRQKNKITFVNGHILYYRTLQSEGDIRSYNLTRAHLLEASEIKHESYVQLQTRVRNEAAIIPKTNSDGSPVIVYNEKEGKFIKVPLYDWLQIIIESNPDSGWIRDDVLFRSEEILIHEKTDERYNIPPGQALPFLSSHIIPTKANYHLPADFEANLRAGKPDWWVRRYLHGSFQYSEGLVYPKWVDRIVPDFEIPKTWQRIIGYDYGLNDNSHFVFGAIDWHGENKITHKPAVFWFRELVRSDMNITSLANDYKKVLRQSVPIGSLYRTPVMDAKSYGKRTVTGDMKQIGQLFREAGCFFKGAHMDLSTRVLHLNDFINNSRVFFFETAFAKANVEGTDYKFPARSLAKDDKKVDKPIDVRNHGINAVEFAMMELSRTLRPDFVDITYDYDSYGNLIEKKAPKKKNQGYHPLMNKEDYDDYDDNEYEGFAQFY